MKKEISRGEMIPPFYGIAERDWQRDAIICYPIPINLFVLLWNDFINFIKNPVRPK